MPDALTPWIIFALLVGGFASGSVPFGLLAGKLKGIDIRQHGSKNIGATNALRVLGRPIGYAVFLLDALKGAIPVLIAGAITGTLGRIDPAPAMSWIVLGVAVAAVLGHVFSPWVGFKGGKGVATAFGGLLAVFPIVTFAAVGAFVIWLVTVKVSRYVSLASIAAAIALPPLVLASPSLARLVGAVDPGATTDLRRLAPALIVTSALSLLVIIKHRANIQRLRAGTENRVGRKA
jgi:glycerol-3-phosphate acyltransferase PlsY